MPLTEKPPKVFAGVGQKHPYTVTSWDRVQITVMACTSASGYRIPPMFISDHKHLQLGMTMGEVPETSYSLSDSGWINAELFQEAFRALSGACFFVSTCAAPPKWVFLPLQSEHHTHGCR